MNLHRIASIGFFFLSLTSFPLGAENKEPGGIVFDCDPALVSNLEREMDAFLRELRFPATEVQRNRKGSLLRYTLNTPIADTNTLDLYKNKKLDIHPDILEYKRFDGQILRNAFTSKKEILAAMLQHGREYRLQSNRCSVSSLREHIGVRQNIAKWNQVAFHRWVFPEKWNEKGELISKDRVMNSKYWTADKGCQKGIKAADAVADPFTGAFEYEIYCLMATRLVTVQGIFDYYRHVAPNSRKLGLLEAAAAGFPISEIQPYFDENRAMTEKGKFLTEAFPVPGDNWIPGDSGFILNTDDKSSEQAGYEGSNFVYQGGGLFSNFWADSGGRRATRYYYGSSLSTLDSHLLEVYHWRLGVTENWQHDPRRAFLTEKEVLDLRGSPKDGGLLEPIRRYFADGVNIDARWHSF